MTKEREALNLALDFLMTRRMGAELVIDAIQEALAQPEQESVAMWDGHHQVEFGNLSAYKLEKSSWIPLYTTPPQRPWVGLTIEDKKEYIAQDFGGSRTDAMDWTEKRLMEKNTRGNT